ncbi:MAG: hypothetical protein EP330_21600 [Deltaproteobacteria bacterium]|nr:MAG: hypothetical protein EP330_21600 [Deltaproteobacteria bacterium]
MLSLLLVAALAQEPAAEPSFECDGSEEFCARLRKALELGEQLEGKIEREVFEGVERVHRNDVVPRRLLKPHPPIEASVRYPEPTRCAYRVFLDEKGYAYDLRFLNCPTLFHACMLEAIQEARWEPVREGGRKVKATFADSYTFE